MIDVLVAISASPERFAQIEVRKFDKVSSIVDYWTCPNTKIKDTLAEKEDYHYVQIVLGGPQDYINKLKEDLQDRFQEAEVLA